MSSPLHMLILEDSPSDVELMLHKLRRAGFEPHWQHVATQPDFVARLAPPPDIILADYALPQFDALHALCCVQEQAPDVPVIVVTGALSDEAAVACLKQGAADYLLKDRLGRLGEAVRHALAERDLRVQHREARDALRATRERFRRMQDTWRATEERFWRTHDALRATEERFRALSEHASDLVGILDAAGTYRYASPSHQRILGYAPVEMQGRNVFELIHPEDVPPTQAVFAALLQTPGAMETAEFRMRHADGSWRTLEGIGTNRLHDPAVRGIIANARDVTERKQVEAERVVLLAREQAARHVAEARAQLAAIVEASEDAIIGKTLDGTITSWNPAATRLYGYGAGEAIGQSMSILVPPDRRDELAEMLARVAEGESIPQCETERVRKDGTCVAVSVSIAPVRAASGTVVGAAVVARDITARKRAEEALHAREALLRTVVSNAPIILYATDTAGSITLLDGRALQAADSPPERLLGRRVFDHEAGYPDVADGLRRALGGETSTFVSRSEETIFDNTIVPMRDTQGHVIGAIGVAVDVTERERAQEALRASEGRLRTVISNAPLLLYVVDRDGTYVQCEGTGLTRMGRSPQDMVGRNIFKTSEAPHAAEAVRAALAGEETSFVGHWEEITFENRVVPWRDAEGQVVGAIGVALDVSEQARAQEALRTSEARLRTVIDNAPIVLFATDASGVLLLREGRAVREIENPRAHIGQSLIETNREDPEALAHVRRALDGQDSTMINRIGQRIFENHLVPMRDEQGRVTGAIGVATDITERERAEAALREQADLLHLARDAIIVRDPQSVIAFWSRGAEAMYGWSAADALGQVTHTLLETRFPIPLEEIDACLERDGFWTGELVHTTRDGTRLVVESRQALRRDTQGHPIAILEINADITARKQAETLLEERNRELARSNAELEQFASIASHDLRSPLTTIGGYAQLIDARYKGKLDADADEFLAFIVDAVQRMQQLIDDLLAFARLGSPTPPPQPVDCAALVNDVIAQLRTPIEESGAVVTRHGLPTVYGQASQLGQVFQNLIANAIKFRGEAPPRVTVSAQRRGTEWLFTVRDNGIGIDPAQAERIFQIFQRLHTRQEYAGTGLGLAVCKKIVERHGGRIWVESQPGHGARFLLTLPAGLLHHPVPISLQLRPGGVIEER